MKLYIKQKVFSIGAKFSVKDEAVSYTHLRAHET